MYNCIYESGVVWPMSNPACPSTDSVLGGDGAPLLDVIEESEVVNVYTTDPDKELSLAGFSTLGYILLAGVAALILFDRRR